MENKSLEPQPESRDVAVAGSTADDGPLGARGADRTRLDMALATARLSEAARASRGGIPGLAKELFPSAAWRRQLDSISLAEHGRRQDRVTREEALVAESLAHLRAEDILQRAREQAHRLVGAAAAVAKARREQAERAAAAALAKAEEKAAHTLASAEQQAGEMAAAPLQDVEKLNERLSKLRSALEEAEAKLGAFSSHTRRAMAAGTGVIDLDAEQERGDIEAVVESPIGVEPVPAGAVHEPAPVQWDEQPLMPAPLLRPKGRFTVPGLAPERIETLRDELTP